MWARRTAALLRFEGRGEDLAGDSEAAAQRTADLELAVAGPQGFRQRQAIRAVEPQPQQMALALGLRPILEFGAVVQGLVVVDELNVPCLEFHLQMDVGIVRHRIEEIERFDLPLRQRRHVVETLGRIDVAPGVPAVEPPRVPTEDRTFNIYRAALFWKDKHTFTAHSPLGDSPMLMILTFQ